MTKRLIAMILLAASAAFAVDVVVLDLSQPLTFSGTTDVVLSNGGATPVSDSYTPQASNAIAFWYRFTTFTNAAGDFIDYSGNGNVGRMEAGAAAMTYVASPASVYGDGGDSAVCATNNVFLLNGATAVTWSCWVRVVTNKQYAGYLVAGKEAASQIWGMSDLSGAGNMVTFSYNNINTGVATNSFTTDLGTWHWYLGDWGQGTHTRMFVDGVLQGTDTGATNDIVLSAGTYDGKIHLFSDRLVAGRYPVGGVDEVMVRTNRVLSTNEVFQEWQDMPRSLYGR